MCDRLNKLVEWIDYRLPVFTFFKHLGEYRAPKNLSYLWNLGSIAGIGLVIQIVTGLILAMHYTPQVDMAFDSVEHIVRDVNYGWLIRNIHAVGASMFFLAIYLHIMRGVYYGSYKTPREVLWFLGVLIFLTTMATAFMGYVLPWGQMSFWGATVITNLFSAIPLIGESITEWLWGGFSVGNPTLNRFFALHFLLPFVIVGLVCLHLVALHQHGSNNPTGVEVKSAKDTIPFNPYYTVKDFVGFGVYFILFAYFVFFEPDYLNHPDNFIIANPMVTPPHIVPEWYFLPFYAILRSIPNKLAGVIAMVFSILILLFLPWLDKSKIKSLGYRPLSKFFFWTLVIDSILLGYIGSQPPEGIYIIIGQMATFYYFTYFLLITPLVSKHENTLPEPESIDASTKKN